MPKVLVTDASKRASLAVIRSLGRKGIQITAGDSILQNVETRKMPISEIISTWEYERALSLAGD